MRSGIPPRSGCDRVRSLEKSKFYNVRALGQGISSCVRSFQISTSWLSSFRKQRRPPQGVMVIVEYRNPYAILTLARKGKPR